MIDWMEMLDADVLTLGMTADEQRRSASGTNLVTYLRVHRADFHAAGTAAVREAAVDQFSVPDGALEVRSYSVPPTLDEAVARLRAMKAAAGPRRVVAYSWLDLLEHGWTGPADLQRLVDAGLADVAELPIDRVADVDAAITALVAAGANPRRLTIAHSIGDIRVDILTRAQRLFEAHGSLRRFSPLPRVAPIDKPTTGYDDVRMVALARLALPGRSIEVDWDLYGPKLAQVALTFGADHLDGVSATDDESLGRRRSPVEDVERNILAAGFEPCALGPGQW